MISPDGTQPDPDPVLLSVLARRTSNAVIVTDPEGRITWVNDGFTRITGYRSEEALGWVPGQLLQGPRSDPDTVARMATALTRREGFQVELVNYRKDGRAYWIDIDCQPIVQDGELTHYIAIQTDVTERKTLEENLLRAERVARMGHWTLDVASGAVAWSDETYRIFGMRIGDPIPDVDDLLRNYYHPSDAPEVRAILAQGTADGKGFSFRKRLLIDGETRWIEARAECDCGPDGQAQGFFGTVQEVTELVETEQTRRDQEDRFQAMADTIPGVAFQWVHRPDGSQGFTYLSPNAEAVLGHSVAALIDNWELLAIDARDQDRFDASIREALATRGDWTFGGRRVGNDGGVQWFQASAKLVDGPSGELIYNGLLVDTTAETAAQEALRDSDLRLRTLMDAVPAAISYRDQQGVFRYANLACRARAGDEHRELIGRHWRDAYAPEDIAFVTPKVEQAMAGERVSYLMTHASDAEDDDRIYETTLVPDLDANGTVNGVFSIAFDVSDYKRREQELVAARQAADAADRAKSAFLATMSHELRTPLNAINGYAEIMSSEMFGPLGHARYSAYMQDILASGRYLLELVEGVLDLASVDAGQQTLTIEPVGVARIADAAASILDGKARAAGVHLDVATVEGTTVYADTRAVKQVLVNLLDNAVKYGRPGDTVRLSASCQDSIATITVGDTGPGLDPADVPRVLQPFVRGKTETPLQANDAPGAGIGLALVKRLVEAMDGTLTIDTAAGQGMSVQIRLAAPAPSTITAQAS